MSYPYNQYGMDEATLAALMASLGVESMNFSNFNQNLSPLSYDADAGMYDSDLNFTGQPRNNWAQTQKVAANYSQYKLKLVWSLNGAATSEPVDIQLFQSAFNKGTFAANGDLLFTNTGGNLVTISTVSSSATVVAPSVRQMMNITETEPFVVAFARVTVKDFAQFQNQMVFWLRSQFNAGQYNEISPENFYNPYQQDKLVIDVPMNMRMDKRQGFDWRVNPESTSPGTFINFFVSNIVEPSKALSDQPTVRRLGPNQQLYLPQTPTSVPASQMIAQILAAKNNPTKKG